MSLRLRLALPFLLLIILSLLGLELYLDGMYRRLLTSGLETRLLQEARLIASLVTAGDLAPENSEKLNAITVEWAENLTTRVTVILADGTVVAESTSSWEDMVNHANRPEFIQALAENVGTSLRFSTTTQEQYMYVAAAIDSPEGRLGVVRLAYPLVSLEESIWQMRRAIIGVGIWIVLATGLVGMVMTGRMTQSLRALTMQVREIAGMPPLEPQRWGLRRWLGVNEVDALDRAFSVMSARLRRQFQALQAEQTKMDALLQQMSSGVFIVDPSGNVALANAAAAELFGIPVDNAVGRSLIEVVRYHQVVEAWETVVREQESQVTTMEVGLQRLYLQVIATPLAGDLAGSTLLLVQDLTHLRRLETIRQDFMSNISHELRTPLASLKALTETLLDGAMDDPEISRRFLTRMETEVDALTLMVQELLELARIDSGRVPLQLTPAAPCDLLTSTMDRLSLQAERAGLSLDVDCPDSLPMVLADSPRLEQVLVNLLHNAIKFTPSPGKITLRAFSQEDMVVFQVQDTGRGISKTDLPRIFERFFKTDRSRSEGGTGLGLAIARHLVEGHGGRISVESRPGQGSTFWFTIPVSDQ